jgi:hypothetical protein
MSGAHAGPGPLARAAFRVAAWARHHPDRWADPWATWDGQVVPPPLDEPPLAPLPRRPADCVVWPACACPGPDCPAIRHPWPEPGATDPRDLA